MRRLLLAVAILFACDDAPGAQTDRDVCLEAFECVSACDYPLDAVMAKEAMKPDCSDLDGQAASDCNADLDEWADEMNALTATWQACTLQCVDQDLPEGHPNRVGAMDAGRCATIPDLAACEAPSCDQF